MGGSWPRLARPGNRIVPRFQNMALCHVHFHDLGILIARLYHILCIDIQGVRTGGLEAPTSWGAQVFGNCNILPFSSFGMSLGL